jgi:hypothetical protein
VMPAIISVDTFVPFSFSLNITAFLKKVSNILLYRKNYDNSNFRYYQELRRYYDKKSAF